MAHGRGLSMAIADKRFADGAPPLFTDFRLEVAPASVVAVLGPSGIGKSTLLRLVAGIDSDFSGRIRIDDLEVTRAPPPGFVFQDPRLLPWLTAVDNVRIADPAMGRAAAAVLLERVGLAGSAEAYPHQLSGGMQRRVALARALAAGAGVLLLDEPFVSLDRPLVEEMQRVTAELFARERPTALLVSHNADDAARLADRAVVLAGRPAAIVADIGLTVPREERQAEEIAAYTQQLSQAMSGGQERGGA